MSLQQSVDARVNTSRKGLREQLRQIWLYRGLLRLLVRKELQVKYKNSFLGFLWSLLNPAMYLVIFTIVFQFILGSGIPRYAIFLLSGLLVWNLFSNSVAAATASITANAPLVGRVAFPREVLPLASVGAGLVHFFLQGLVLVTALVVFNHQISMKHAVMTMPALGVLLVFTAGIALIVAAANVYLRDVEHLVEITLLGWFWMTPIVYQHHLVSDQLAGTSYSWLQWVNPLTSIVLVFQRGLYNVIDVVGGTPSPRPIAQAETTEGVLRILPTNMGAEWYVTHLGVIAVVSLVLLLTGLVYFGRVEGNFAEEL